MSDNQDKQVVAPEKKWATTKELFNTGDVRRKFEEMLGKKAQGFITSVLQIVASNSYLAKADPMSVYQSAAMAATLDLPLNNDLGFAYIVPYNQSEKIKTIDGPGNAVEKWHSRQVAQFQMGYKGFIQLAQRTGRYRTINAVDVRKGEIKHRDRLSGFVQFEWIQDDEERMKAETAGYISYFELLSGFSKSWYMTNAQLIEHAGRYSQTFKKKKGLWVDNFDAMAQKTVLKLNLSKYGPLSIEMEKALIADQSVIKDVDTMDVEHVDNPSPEIEHTITWEDLNALTQEKEPLLNKQEFDDAKRILNDKEEASYRKLWDYLQAKTEGSE